MANRRCAILVAALLSTGAVPAQDNPLAMPPDRMPEICQLDWATAPETFSAGDDAETIRGLVSYWYGENSSGIGDSVRAVYTNQYVPAGGEPDDYAVLITLWQFASVGAAEQAVDAVTASGARNVRALLDFDQAVILKYESAASKACADWLWREIETGMTGG